MSRPRRLPGRALALLASGFALVALAACDEDGKSAPERCLDPALPLFDPASAGAPADDNAQYPCVTPVGHSVSYVGNAPGAAGSPSTPGPSNQAGSGNGGAGGAGGEGGGGS